MTGNGSEGRPADNETRRQIAEAAANGTRHVRLDTNPTFIALDAILEEATSGTVVVTFNAGHETTQGNGVVGGGTLAAMLDAGMAAAVMSALTPGHVPTTISLTVNMLRPGAPGRLRVEAAVERLGRRVTFASARIMNTEGAVLANGTSSLAIIDMVN